MPDPSDLEQKPCLHFVRFRGEEYWSAVRIWGRPDVIHRLWDGRAVREIAPGDIIVFAQGDEHQPVAPFNGQDVDERLYSELLGLPYVSDY